MAKAETVQNRYALVDGESTVRAIYDSAAEAEPWGHSRELIELTDPQTQVGDVVEYDSHGVQY